MTNLSHVRTTRLLVFTVLAFAATSLALAQSRPPIVNELAKTYGIDSWDQIDGVRYTWNGQFGTVNISHVWEWHPKTGEVTFQSKDKDGKPVKVTYIRTQLDSAPANVKDQIEPSFVNDNYWVFFPFHVDWDRSADVQDQGTQKLPQGTGSGKRVVVKYPAEAGGYTPGDTWELYLASTGRVEQMAYHRGGPKKPSVVICGWTGYKKAGPLLFSTEHRGTADGAPLRVWFSNVSVKLVGSDSWIDAK